MAGTLIRYLEALTLADHHMIDLLDDAGELPFPDLNRESWLEATNNAVFLHTVSSEMPLLVRVEAWDGEPPDEHPDGGENGLARLASGLLSINFLVDPDAGSIIVGGPGAYRVRAHAAGREESAGKESYLVRFWPNQDG
jgi:hypothetical protein